MSARYLLGLLLAAPCTAAKPGNKAAQAPQVFVPPPSGVGAIIRPNLPFYPDVFPRDNIFAYRFPSVPPFVNPVLARRSIPLPFPKGPNPGIPTLVYFDPNFPPPPNAVPLFPPAVERPFPAIVGPPTFQREAALMPFFVPQPIDFAALDLHPGVPAFHSQIPAASAIVMPPPLAPPVPVPPPIPVPLPPPLHPIGPPPPVRRPVRRPPSVAQPEPLERSPVEPPPSIAQPTPVQPPSSVAQPTPVRPPPSVAQPTPVQPPPSVAQPTPVQPPPSVAQPTPVQPPPSISRPTRVQQPPSVAQPAPVAATPAHEISLPPSVSRT